MIFIGFVNTDSARVVEILDETEASEFTTIDEYTTTVKVYTFGNKNFYRYGITNLTANTKYTINTTSCFTTLKENSDPTIMYASCDGRDLYDPGRKDPAKHWKIFKSHAEQINADFIIHGGDNIYMDNVFLDIIELTENHIDSTTSRQMEQMINNHYISHFSQPDKLFCMQHYSNIMTIDDHDIIDDYGQTNNIPQFTDDSLKRNVVISHVTIEKYNHICQCMKRAYLVYQHLLIADFDQADSPGTVYLYKSFDIGNVRLILTDNRYERKFLRPDKMNGVFGSAQMDWILAQMQDADDLKMKTYIVSSTPLISWSKWNIRFLNMVGKPYLNDGSFTDDIAKSTEKKRILEQAEKYRDRVLFISGDLHVGYFGDEGNITQIVSSPISTSPNDDLLFTLLTRFIFPTIRMKSHFLVENNFAIIRPAHYELIGEYTTIKYSPDMKFLTWFAPFCEE